MMLYVFLGIYLLSAVLCYGRMMGSNNDFSAKSVRTSAILSVIPVVNTLMMGFGIGIWIFDDYERQHGSFLAYRDPKNVEAKRRERELKRAALEKKKRAALKALEPEFDFTKPGRRKMYIWR